MNRTIALSIIFSLISFFAYSQSDSNARYLYRPSSERLHTEQQDEADILEQKRIMKQIDTTIVFTIDSTDMTAQDTSSERMQFIRDSIAAREAFVRDSILKREAFVRDSIEKRLAFIRDSIYKRNRRIDSLNFLADNLPILIEASIKSSSDFIIIRQSNLIREEDIALSDMNFELLPFNLDKPYMPWRNTFNFKDGSVKISADTVNKSITRLKTPYFIYGYEYSPNSDILLMKGRERVLQKRTGKMYKSPLDSVFFDPQGRIAKIKKYNIFYQLVNNKKGPLYFIALDEVKQYTYASGNTISEIEVVKFVDRGQPYDPVKVSSIFNYYIEQDGSKYMVRRNQRPINDFADGVFTYNYNPNGILESIAFNNNKNTENWKTIIETNEEGNATRYIYEDKGTVSRTLLINYNDDPKAKYKVETITCSFDKDGISFYQYNNTTHKTRTRDKLTLEWTDWK